MRRFRDPANLAHQAVGMFSDEPRLNPPNDMLSSANMNAFFDVGLMCFADDGRMLAGTQSGVTARSRAAGLLGQSPAA